MSDQRIEITMQLIGFVCLLAIIIAQACTADADAAEHVDAVDAIASAIGSSPVSLLKLASEL